MSLFHYYIAVCHTYTQWHTQQTFFHACSEQCAQRTDTHTFWTAHASNDWHLPRIKVQSAHSYKDAEYSLTSQSIALLGTITKPCYSCCSPGSLIPVLCYWFWYCHTSSLIQLAILDCLHMCLFSVNHSLSALTSASNLPASYWQNILPWVTEYFTTPWM